MKYLASLAAVLSLLASSPQTPPQGTFALQGGVQKTEGFLTMTALGNAPLDRRITTYMTKRGSTTPLRSYDVDMTKLLHMIVVSDDFRTFMHVHPTEQPDGRFSIDQRLPKAALYHVYSDAQPKGLGQQVFRFDVPLGAAARSRDLSETATTTQVGPYVVSLSTNALSSSKESAITVHIRKSGKPARDLHPYLGALAHAVFLNAADLTYVHVHPMALGTGDDMSGMNMGSMDMPAANISDPSSPDMMLHVELKEPGTYKLWLQFRGGSQLYVAPFILKAS